MHIALEPPAQPDVIALIDELDAYQKPLYPLESHYGFDIDALAQPHVPRWRSRTPSSWALLWESNWSVAAVT